MNSWPEEDSEGEAIPGMSASEDGDDDARKTKRGKTVVQTHPSF
jgi:hypothetical protein